MKLKSKTDDLVILEGFIALRGLEITNNYEYDVYSTKHFVNSRMLLIGKCHIKTRHLNEFQWCEIHVHKKSTIFNWVNIEPLIDLDGNFLFGFEPECVVENALPVLKWFYLSVNIQNDLKIKLSLLIDENN